jgi:hypothetical protein
MSVAACLACACLCTTAGCEDAARPLDAPQLEMPTLHCLGVYWIIRGDDNANAVVGVEHRRRGVAEWRTDLPLFRVEKGGHIPGERESKLEVPDDAWLFAGSAMLLEPDTEYELRLTLTDPDGGAEQVILVSHTIGEPIAAADAPRQHVIPGNGGGSGGEDDPYRGLETAQEHAAPGDVFLLHGGTYEGTFTVRASGEPSRPIVWRAAGDGEAVIDAQGQAAVRPGRGISAGDVSNVWFEGLFIRNADYGIVAHRSSNIVIRRCHIDHVDYGITCTNNDNDAVKGFFISDNTIQGPSTWPRTKGIENARGIQVTGTGHVICYNRIRGFADAIDTFGSQRCTAIDVHNNEINEMTDDGIEMDYSERNTRCFRNRLTNVFQGISVQPIYGGPVYIFRNAMYNVVAEPFKMHNSPSGALMLHNTSVKQGMPLVLWTGEPVRNCIYRNNLFIGSDGNYAYETTAPMVGCDFDCDGFGGGPWGQFLKWNGTRYKSLADVHERAPVYAHAVDVGAESVFASGVIPPVDETRQFDTSVNDLRLKADCRAIDAGILLPGISDEVAGAAPDLGAYELGSALPHYGPRPEPAADE